MTYREPVPYPENCAKCDEAISLGQAYCGRCGNEVDPLGVPACPSCHASVWKADRFCRQCGTPMCTCKVEAGRGRQA